MIHETKAIMWYIVYSIQKKNSTKLNKLNPPFGLAKTTTVTKKRWAQVTHIGGAGVLLVLLLLLLSHSNEVLPRFGLCSALCHRSRIMCDAAQKENWPRYLVPVVCAQGQRHLPLLRCASALAGRSLLLSGLVRISAKSMTNEGMIYRMTCICVKTSTNDDRLL